ncbi:cytochrome P450 [Amycolatopsis antarctica]|uniref:Cytochrome P450 n=1 Tax=Amycolatopsis antarctica TaxID=1854586 RepID=A0A263DB06_9PSEU|nr:cytochrome P450 [Amycolatopsis antarctica]OZM75168.1 cytochrome P450 [Amycolatopsis antarctica]
MTGTAADETFVFDPFAPEFAENPYPVYRELQVRAPVYEHPLGFWMLSRREDVFAFLRSQQSVEARNIDGGDMRRMATEAGMDDRRNGGQSMLDKDPPDHTRLRKLVSKAFTPRSIEALEPQVDELVDEALDAMAEAGSVDLVEALALPLPFTVISRMLGMPPHDHAYVRELAGLVVKALEPIDDPVLLKQVVEADVELAGFIEDIVAWKRGNPGDDLLTGLIAAEEDGDTLTDTELVSQVVLLYVAGHETTVNLIANGSLALMRNPEQHALLREQPDLTGNAVEELLRFDSPVQHTRRVTLEPYEVAGTTIPRGAYVMAGLASANRDPEFWGEDAGELRLERPNARQHLSFGGGPHHCLGAALARLEGRVAFGRLVHRFPGMALDGEVVWNGRMNLRGPSTLPVSV